MSRRGPVAAVAAVLLAALLPGCLFVGGQASFGAPLDARTVATIVPGRSTKGEVLALLGPPNEYKDPELGSALVDDELRLAGVLAVARRAENVFTWQHDRATARGTALVLFNWFDSATATDLLVVFFDAHDVVSDVAWRPAEGAP